MNNLNHLDSLACLCGPGELCGDCVPEGLTTLVQLKLSLPWARETPVVRKLVSPQAYLRHTSKDN